MFDFLDDLFYEIDIDFDDIMYLILGIILFGVVLFGVFGFFSFITGDLEEDNSLKDINVKEIGYIVGENLENEKTQMTNIIEKDRIENIVNYFNSYDYNVQKDVPIQDIRYKITIYDTSNNILETFYILNDFSSYVEVDVEVEVEVESDENKENSEKNENNKIETKKEIVRKRYFSDEEIDIIPIEKYLGF